MKQKQRSLWMMCLTGLLAVDVSMAHASSLPADIFPYKTVYFGINVGGGSTEWKYLVDTTDQGMYAPPSTPIGVSEGGPSWGVVFGYDVSKNFAVELQYVRFADARIDLGPESSYPIESMISKTEAYSLSGKFLVPVAQTHLRAFASIGVGLVERRDPLVNYDASGVFSGLNYTSSCITPYLSSGVVYSFTRHWMLESGFQYYTGFGRSELNPVAGFIPFAWDAYGRLAYQL